MTTKFGVSERKEKNLLNKMNRLKINESDLIEKFIRSGGPGGQHANKTSTCVYIKHIPSGIEVKCERERSRSVNRFLARKILAGKIEDIILGKKSEENKKREKIRRQKRRRSRKAKEKILHNKKKQSQKKSSRGLTKKLITEEEC